MNIKFAENDKYVQIKLSGRITAVEILNAFDTTVYHNNYKPGMGRVWDFREADLSDLSAGIIYELAHYSLGFSAGINDVKVSYVVSRSNEYNVMRMLQTFSQGTKTQTMVYYNIANAIKWVLN